MHHSESVSTVAKSQNNPFIFRLLFVFLCVMLAVCWRDVKQLPAYCTSHFGVAWILCAYRNLNKNATSIQNEFRIAFWVRLGWSTIYQICNTGKLYSNKHDFALSLLECFVATTVCTAIPLSWVERLWSAKTVRWLIFVLDQSMTNGLRFITLFKTEFIAKNYHSVIAPISVMVSRAIARPSSQIIAAYFNGNLTAKNAKKWLTVAYLNSARALTLCLVNYAAVTAMGEGK